MHYKQTNQHTKRERHRHTVSRAHVHLHCFEIWVESPFLVQTTEISGVMGGKKERNGSPGCGVTAKERRFFVHLLVELRPVTSDKRIGSIRNAQTEPACHV